MKSLLLPSYILKLRCCKEVYRTVENRRNWQTPFLKGIWRRSGGGWAGQRVEFSQSNNVFPSYFSSMMYHQLLREKLRNPRSQFNSLYVNTYNKCCCEQDVPDTAMENNAAGVLLTALPDSLKYSTNTITLWMNCTVCDIYYQFAVHNFGSGTPCQICIHEHMREKSSHFQIIIPNKDWECVHEDFM